MRTGAIGPFAKNRFSPGTTNLRFSRTWKDHKKDRSMFSYRLYLLAQSHLLTDQAYYAENDDIACSIAALVAESCSDRCNSFELWKGTQLLLKEKSLHAVEIFERKRETIANKQSSRDQSDDALRNLHDAIEASAVAVVQGAMKMNPEIDRSEKLHLWLTEMRARQRQS
jgi:hypothetical protein